MELEMKEVTTEDKLLQWKVKQEIREGPGGKRLRQLCDKEGRHFKFAVRPPVLAPSRITSKIHKLTYRLHTPWHPSPLCKKIINKSINQ